MNYALTAFSKKGELLLNEDFEAENDEEAIAHGRKRLSEESLWETTHRLVRAGQMILFHR
ncbi:YhzD-like protein [Salsuginibacillus halophilus]|uniref:YhzD-like protein n=1 Tax=Salsuginibacillus halophilus TaxID=517424 RepID=A0A2P8HG22_9BACI|nr:YhzD family protein [Salsuginibacillus halophilus]PSL45171.1 YhzD-like protein [Salsuginibacillus halophilus]